MYILEIKYLSNQLINSSKEATNDTTENFELNLITKISIQNSLHIIHMCYIYNTYLLHTCKFNSDLRKKKKNPLHIL